MKKIHRDTKTDGTMHKVKIEVKIESDETQDECFDLKPLLGIDKQWIVDVGFAD